MKSEPSSTRGRGPDHNSRCARCPALALSLLILLNSGVGSLMADEDDRIEYLRDIVVPPGEKVRDAVCILCSIEALGSLSGDAVSIGGTISLGGSIDGDAVAVGGGIHLGSAGRISGEAVAMGGPVERAPGSIVQDETTQMPYFHLPGQRRIYLKGALTLAVILPSIAGIFCLVWRFSRLRIVAGVLRTRPWAVCLVGLTFWVVVISIYRLSVYAGPVESFIQSLNSALIVVSLGLGFTGASLAVGRRLRPSWTPLRSLLLGTSAATLGMLAPVLGCIVFLALSVIGPGASLVSRFGTAGTTLQSRTSSAESEA